MDQNQEHLQQLHEIRSIMERSTKFISLSGLSGIVAGCVALTGAGVQYWYMLKKGLFMNAALESNEFLLFSIVNFAAILIVAVSLSYYFTYKKAKKQSQSLWNGTSQRMMIHFSIPLASGGAFCAVLFYHGLIGLIGPASLIFYGLALVNGSNYTLSDVRNLGLIEIALGFISAFYIGFGLLFWAIGFGVMHIIYGILMYYKYDRVADPQS